MMSAPMEPGLPPRLARLTGEDATCCMPGYRALGRRVARVPGFSEALLRAKALGDRHRLVALALLKRRRELCACEIQAALGVSHATVSHHMTTLETAGLVTSERRGKWVYYRLVDAAGVEVP